MTATPFQPETIHDELGPDFYDQVAPARFPAHILRYRNQRWAARCGLGDLSDADWIEHFGRFVPLPGSFEQPLALRYHGHQFRAYNADLGDGRGFLFAQLRDGVDKRLLDLGTKGSGRTPWSRGADGRLTLKGGVREVLATEMLGALGVATSQSFSLIETGESLFRGDEPSPARSSVLVRLSHSHLRIGTFQRLAFLGLDAQLASLVGHTIRHYMPHCERPDDAGRATALLEQVVANCARLAAQWTMAGFVHGVLNTDNINLTGESFDYGPWRFLPHYEPGFTAAYFDETGLYAFGRQPDTLAWNLTRFAETLLPLATAELLEPALNRFWPRFQAELADAALWRLGLVPADLETDTALVAEIFRFLEQSRIGFEQFFFDWRGGEASAARAMQSPEATHYAGAAFAALGPLLLQRASADDANLDHPYFARPRPRTMLIDEVEAIWSAIAEADDWQPFHAALDDLAEMRAAYGTGPCLPPPRRNSHATIAPPQGFD